jgi:hypothetical protein
VLSIFIVAVFVSPGANATVHFREVLFHAPSPLTIDHFTGPLE